MVVVVGVVVAGLALVAGVVAVPVVVVVVVPVPVVVVVVVVVVPAAVVAAQLSVTDDTGPVGTPVGSAIEEIGVPGGTSTVKENFWPVSRVT